MSEANVSTPCAAYDEALGAYWETLDALRGGTQTMRDAGTTHLPMHRAEEAAQYTYRRDRSFLFSAYDDAISRLSAKPFSRPVTLKGELPERLAEMTNNIDGNGRTLTQQAREVFDAGCNYGLSFLFVDYPATGGKLNMAEERARGIMPRIIHYAPPSVIAWTTEQGANGSPVLTSVRLAETRTVQDGEWGEATQDAIRVVTEGGWQLWVQNEKDEWVPETDFVPHTLGRVPLLPFYTNRTGFFTAKPPMWGLADLNVQHWQVSSDYAYILSVAQVPQVVVKGITEEDLVQVTWGPGRVWQLPEGADAGFLEPDGTGLQSGREELDRIEARMRTLAMEPFVAGSGTPTATGRAIDESKSQAAVQAWIRGLEGVYEDAFGLAAGWVGAELDDEFSVDVFSEFALSLGKSEDLKYLETARARGDIDHETYLQEIQRRGVLAEAADIEVVMAHAEQEAPAVPVVPFGVDGEDDDEPEEE